MNNLLERLLSHHRMLLLTAVIFASMGALLWRTMPRQEDPEITSRWGSVTVSFTGADPETVEAYVVEPLEDALAEIEEIRWLQATASEGFALLSIILKDEVDEENVESVWKDIEDAVDRAAPTLPREASKPFVDRGTSDLEVVVLAVTGSDDTLQLRKAANDLRDDLLGLDQVARIKVIGDPGEEVVVKFDESQARALRTSRSAVVGALSARNVIDPGGSVRTGERRASIAPVTEFESLDDIGQTRLRTPNGTTIPLSAVATVTHGTQDPALERMRIGSRPAVGLGIVAEKGGNVVAFGEALRVRVDALRPNFEPLNIEEVTFQPDRVRARIDELERSLVASMLIVGGLVLVSMGLRMGLLVTAVIPLVVFSAVAIFALGGGILHQMSIAALVIALGMLVDNAIVVVENIVRRIELGASPQEAALGAGRELAVPLFTATGTTVAAFVPMMMSSGAVGEFTRAIPVLVTIVLVISYVYAVLVTPVLSRWVLRHRIAVSGPSRLDAVSQWLATQTVRRFPAVIVGILVGLVGVSSLVGRVPQNFFPGSDRNQILVDLRLPDGSDIEATGAAVEVMEAALAQHPEVLHTASFIGRSAPHFYYNIQDVPRAPHFAQILVTTASQSDNAAVEAFVRSIARERLPGRQVIAAALEQGPGTAAPIEIRIRGNELQQLREVASTFGRALEAIDGTRDVRDDMSLGVPSVVLRVDDAAAARYGVSRRDVAAGLYAHTRGTSVGTLRTDDDPIPVRIRSAKGEDTSIEALGGILVATLDGRSIPLSQVVHQSVEWRPAQFRRRDRARVVSVLAHLQPGVSYSTVVNALKVSLGDMDLPSGVSIEFGGEAEGADDANSAMLTALPLGVLMLVGFLMAEFNSFRRVFIVLTTVPLAAVGVIPGLLLGSQPFGFMSMLGVIALAGVVVNNAIVLLDVVERRRSEGASIERALIDAVQLRLRPILLTTMTTVAGLLPLALSGAALWPPLAWAMISGLIASTLLTIVFVPALYRALFKSNRSERL